MSFKFRIVEHLVPCQHIREYAQATANEQEDVLHLAVKQYIPLNNPNPRPGDVTIIGGHANGFVKELYEPLWEEIIVKLQERGTGVRSIWMADVAQQGQSGIVNEQLLGNDPCWDDHSRDLLGLINMKRKEMPRPIVGIGHSMGGNNLTNLALMHPRLFTTLILLDPVIQADSSAPPGSGEAPAQMSTFRRDVWQSRKAAAEGYTKSKFYQAWDPRAVERQIKYGLRDLPTLLHPSTPAPEGETAVTLSTTKHQEVFTFLRPNYEGSGHNGQSVDRKKHPDIHPGLSTIYPFYRPEVPKIYFRLPEVRPSVLYVFGELSYLSTPEAIATKLRETGIGIGGSGGIKDGKVKGIVLKNMGHLIAMEAVEECADAAAEWISKEMKDWAAQEEEHRKKWMSRTLMEKQTVDEKWKKKIGGNPRKVKPADKARL